MNWLSMIIAAFRPSYRLHDGGGGTTNTTQQFKPPDYTQGAWQDFVNRGVNLTNQPYQAYQGQQVAAPTDMQNQGWNMTQDRALYGAPDLNAGRGAAANVASGAFFNNSPWTDPTYVNNAIQSNANTMANAMQKGTAAQTDSMFARAGAYGGTGWADQQAANAGTLAASVGNMANQYQLANQQMGNSNYMQGINQMLQGGQLGGQLSQDDWTAANALTNAGQQQQQNNQNVLTNQYGNWQQQQNWPYMQMGLLNNYLSGASGNYGTNSSTSNPYGNMGWQQALLGGGGLLASAIGGGLFGH